MKSTKSWLAAALVAAFVLGGARGGEGGVYNDTTSPHEITLVLYFAEGSLDHAGDSDRLDKWEKHFRSAADAVWNYTSNQVAIKEVQVYRYSNPKGSDVIISNDAALTPNSFVYPAKKRIGPIYFPYNLDTWVATHKQTSGCEGQVIGHEMGHGVFGCGDEYKVVCWRNWGLGVNEYYNYRNQEFQFRSTINWAKESLYKVSPNFLGDRKSNLNNFITGEIADSLKALGNGRILGPHTIMNDDTKWEVMSIPNHGAPPPWDGAMNYSEWTGGITLESKSYDDVHFQTWHDWCFANSAWERMEETRGLTYGVRGSGAKPEMRWRLMDGTPVVVLVIDSSGSMSRDGKWKEAQEAARNAVGMAWQDDYVGVITFASSPRTVQSPVKVEDKTTRSAIQSKISGSASGGTDIDKALRQALSDLAGVRTEYTGPECIILLSDGQSTVSDATLWALKARHVTVHTVAYGSDADKVMLRRIAEATGGRMVEENVPNWRAPKSAGTQSRALPSNGNLSQFFAELYAEGRESEQTAKLEGVASGTPIEQKIVVDSFGDIDLTVNLYWETGDMDVALVKPDGTVIERAAAEAAETDLDGGKETDSAFIRVSNPEAGTWKVRVVPAAGSGEQAYLATVSCTGRDNMRIYAETSGDSLTWPAPLVVSASFGGAVPAITGAVVTAVATCPDGTEVPFELNDNGENGDEEAGDGMYAAEFKDFTEDGEYRFDVKGQNVSGMTSWLGASPSLGGELPDPEPVEPFVRRKSLTVQYDGLPEFINATRYTETEFASWTLNRNTGAMTGSMVVSNHPTSRKTLIAPFWYAVTETVNVFLAQVDGYTDDGDPYVNITDKVEAALKAKYGRTSMAPGEWVTIDGVEVYSRNRQIPDMTALWSLWADPPAGDERRVDSYDRDSNGVLDDEEILLAVEHWEALDMDDEALLKRIELWKRGEE